MKRSVLLMVLVAIGALAACTAHQPPPSLYLMPARTLEGGAFDLAILRGKVTVIANIALGCGTSPQLSGLEALYQRYKDQGLSVIGVPRGASKPPADEEIQEYRKTCSLRYGVTFPILSMGPIGGPRIHPILDYVTNSAPTGMQGPIDFNFEKFVLDKKGRVRARFGSFSAPTGTAITETIELLLKEQ